MKAMEALNDPKFKEALEMVHKGYIDKMFIDDGKQPPIPLSLIPLAYENKSIQKGLDRLNQGAKNALYAYDKFLDKQ